MENELTGKIYLACEKMSLIGGTKLLQSCV